MDEFFQEGEEEDYGMQAEMKAFERAAASNPFLELVTGSAFPDEYGERRKKPVSPTDKFYIKAYQTVVKINDSGTIKITQDDMRKMADKTSMVKQLQYKNPVAYILGYIVSKGGSEIDKKRFDKVVDELLPDEEGVEAADVLRYARYWVDFL